MPYEMLLNLKRYKFGEERVLIIGAGFMGHHYCVALRNLGISDVSVITRTRRSAEIISANSGINAFSGGYEQVLDKLGIFDLVIVATPIHQLAAAAQMAAACGNCNILIEKPGHLFSNALEAWGKSIDPSYCRIRVAFNRLTYPNLWKLRQLVEEEGGITSCRYTFTEWVHTIDFSKDRRQVYERWGVSNSLHVISMAHALIDFPDGLSSCQAGNLSWHPSGSIFVGSGITRSRIPFTYHADWGSAGRWGIELMTCKSAYRLIPLEDLFRCEKGSVQWQKIQFEKAFPEVKQGVAEEVAIMLRPELEELVPLPPIELTGQFVSLAEKIFGYAMVDKPDL